MTSAGLAREHIVIVIVNAFHRPGGVKSDARKIEFVEAIQSAFALSIPSHLHSISDFQKLFLTPDPNHLLIPLHPVPREGALAIVTDVGTGSGGRGCAFDEQRVRRTVKSCGPDAPMPGIKFLRSSRFLGATVTTKHGLAGESTKQAVKT
ncbi:hypothetical protein, partial [Bradyrhizobium sp. S69]|uniref:hypothetical protein n=1 Tax=Bradyrhizobium sp. S69 TaxID=1641856 RepID=UPI001FED5C3C